MQCSAMYKKKNHNNQAKEKGEGEKCVPPPANDRTTAVNSIASSMHCRIMKFD